MQNEGASYILATSIHRLDKRYYLFRPKLYTNRDIGCILDQ